jgi:hypothetical protein
MKSQQIAVYASLNEFMVAVGYQNAADQREDDPVWSTLNDNNFKAMMEYKFGVEPRLITMPTTVEAVHEGITSHEAWAYREDLEHDDGEEAPVELEAVATPPDGDEIDANLDDGTNVDSNQDTGEGETKAESDTDKVAEEGGESEEEPPTGEADGEGGEEPTDDEIEGEGDAAQEGGDSEQE